MRSAPNALRSGDAGGPRFRPRNHVFTGFVCKEARAGRESFVLIGAGEEELHLDHQLSQIDFERYLWQHVLISGYVVDQNDERRLNAYFIAREEIDDAMEPEIETDDVASQRLIDSLKTG